MEYRTARINPALPLLRRPSRSAPTMENHYAFTRRAIKVIFDLHYLFSPFLLAYNTSILTISHSPGLYASSYVINLHRHRGQKTNLICITYHEFFSLYNILGDQLKKWTLLSIHEFMGKDRQSFFGGYEGGGGGHRGSQQVQSELQNEYVYIFQIIWLVRPQSLLGSDGILDC